jgi:hypothetical protein
VLQCASYIPNDGGPQCHTKSIFFNANADFNAKSAKDCQRLPKTAKDRQRPSKTVKDRQRPSKTVKDCQRLDKTVERSLAVLAGLWRDPATKRASMHLTCNASDDVNNPQMLNGFFLITLGVIHFV